MVDSGKRSLPGLYAVVVVDLIGFGIVVPILPFYAEAYGASATTLGWLFTCYAGMQFLFAPLWGRLSDRIGRRPVMLLTIAGTAGSLVLLGLADSLLWLFVARLLGGMFAANISVASALITDVTSDDERSKYMGLLGASFGIGFILGPALGGFLAPRGYAVPMLVAASMALANLVVASFTLREPPRLEPSAGLSRWQLPTASQVRWLCLSYFIFTMAVTQLETVFAFLMLDRFGYGPREVAYVLVAMGLIMVLVQGGAIRPLAARFGERRLLVVATVLLAPSLALVPWMPNIAIMLVPLAIASVGRGLAHPAMLTLVSAASGAGERGLVMGSFQSSASLARVLGPIAAGVLYDCWQYAPFVLAGASMLLVLMIAIAVLSDRQRQSP